MSANFLNTMRAAWLGFLEGKNPDLQPECKHAYTNNFTRRWRTSANDDSVIDGVQIDSSNRLLVGASVLNPFRTQENFYLAPNALLGTQPFWISDGYYYITACSEMHATAGNDAGAVTAQIIIDRGVGAPGSGSNGGGSIMSNTFNLKGTANTAQSATLTAKYFNSTIANAKLTNPSAPLSGIAIRPGDRLSFKTTGTLTTLAGVIVSITFAPSGTSNCYTFFQNENSRIVTSPFAIISQAGLTVTGISAFWSAAGTDAGAVTLQVTQDTDTTAPGAGTALLQSTINLKAAANTVVNGTLSTTAANLILGSGNRLSVLITGTTTALAGLVVCVYTTPLISQEAMFDMNTNGDLGTNQCFAGPFDRPYLLNDVFAAWHVVSTSMKVVVTADGPGVAPGAGVVVHTDNASAGFDTSGTIDTVNIGTLANRRNRILPAGWRLGLKFSGTKNTLAGLVVGASLQPYN